MTREEAERLIVGCLSVRQRDALDKGAMAGLVNMVLAAVAAERAERDAKWRPIREKPDAPMMVEYCRTRLYEIEPSLRELPSYRDER
ncbi:MAG TPA: hypothetical protein VGR45_19100, partial [Stellaceae bacterium]|nr:hypothetical protein [Stellaceae bacterium]